MSLLLLAGFVEMLRLGDPDLIEVVLQNLTVAARMLPSHKQDLVALLGAGIAAGRYSHEHIRVGTCSSSMTFIVWRSRDDSKLRQLLYLQDQMDSYVKAKPLLLSFH